jgi:phosphoserine phosphatase/nucleoside-diphosphate-sugar epimerase
VTPPSAATGLGRSHVFLTGGTGFVGQAVLERLLSSHPETTISLLVRTKGSVNGQDRLRLLLRKPAFRVWREAVGDEGVEKAVTERIRIIEGGLGSVPALPADLDVVIHSASTVSFDPPIDQAFDTNVGGAIGLYEALIASGGDPRVVHVSTCYVGGLRKGVAPESRLTHDVDWRAEYAAARSARDRVELLSREPERLRGFMDAAREVHGKEGPQAAARASEEARVEWVTSQLVDAGRARAESLGWTDVYTLTKAFAERAAEELWAGSGHRLSVVRPAIIESALEHPFPGWIDGFKVADPLILAYGRGLLPEFPGLPDSVLDLIPVDHVVNAILAVAANPGRQGEPRYYQVASGASNPLPFHEMFENVNEYFTANPMPQPGKGHIRVPNWQFPGGRVVERKLRNKAKLADRYEKFLHRMPSSKRNRRALAKLQTQRADLETLRNFTELYRAYVQTEIIFDDTNTRALHASLPAAVQRDAGFDVAAIDWRDYLQKVHFPAITEMTRAFSKRPEGGGERKPRRDLPERTDVVAVFDMEGTVVDSNLVQQYLWVRSAGFRKAAWPGEVISILGSLPRYLRAERRDRGEFIRTFLRRYEGIPVSRLEKISAGGYGDTMWRHTSSAAVKRIRDHRRAGHRTVLVSGSIALLASPIAELFDEVVAGEMHVKDGVLTGYLARPPLVDEARAAWLTQYAAKHGLDLAGSYGYGDSHADLVWLELLGHPHAVNPDTHLAREAQRRRWSIDDWKRGAGSSKRALMSNSTAAVPTSE